MGSLVSFIISRMRLIVSLIGVLCITNMLAYSFSLTLQGTIIFNSCVGIVFILTYYNEIFVDDYWHIEVQQGQPAIPIRKPSPLHMVLLSGSAIALIISLVASVKAEQALKAEYANETIRKNNILIHNRWKKCKRIMVMLGLFPLNFNKNTDQIVLVVKYVVEAYKSATVLNKIWDDVSSFFSDETLTPELQFNDEQFAERLANRLIPVLTKKVTESVTNDIESRYAEEAKESLHAQMVEEDESTDDEDNISDSSELPDSDESKSAQPVMAKSTQRHSERNYQEINTNETVASMLASRGQLNRYGLGYYGPVRQRLLRNVNRFTSWLTAKVCCVRDAVKFLYNKFVAYRYAKRVIYIGGITATAGLASYILYKSLRNSKSKEVVSDNENQKLKPEGLMSVVKAVKECVSPPKVNPVIGPDIGALITTANVELNDRQLAKRLAKADKVKMKPNVAKSMKSESCNTTESYLTEAKDSKFVIYQKTLRKRMRMAGQIAGGKMSSEDYNDVSRIKDSEIEEDPKNADIYRRIFSDEFKQWSDDATLNEYANKDHEDLEEKYDDDPMDDNQFRAGRTHKDGSRGGTGRYLHTQKGEVKTERPRLPKSEWLKVIAKRNAEKAAKLAASGSSDEAKKLKSISISQERKANRIEVEEEVRKPEHLVTGSTIIKTPIVYCVEAVNKIGKKQYFNAYPVCNGLVLPRHGVAGTTSWKILVGFDWLDMPMVPAAPTGVIPDQVIIPKPPIARIRMNTGVHYREPINGESATLYFMMKDGTLRTVSSTVGKDRQITVGGVTVVVKTWNGSSIDGSCCGVYISNVDGCIIGFHGIGSSNPSSKPLFYPMVSDYQRYANQALNGKTKVDLNTDNEYFDKFHLFINEDKSLTPEDLKSLDIGVDPLNSLARQN